MPRRTATAHDHARALALELGPAWSADERGGTAVLDGPDGMVRVWIPQAGTVRVDTCASPAHLVGAGQGEFTGTASGTAQDLPALARTISTELAPMLARRTEELTTRTERAVADLKAVTARARELLGPKARVGPGLDPGHVRIGWPGGWVELHSDGLGPVYSTNLRADNVRSVRALLTLLVTADTYAAAGA
ncbi:hypothetical protein [Streptacidiphilus sp. EB103A]|uniref:hypothetical protein n=1 Tax=Streptacidiphilus sp. EB103A TaxID=3156275 RepID=UPI003513B7AC